METDKKKEERDFWKNQGKQLNASEKEVRHLGRASRKSIAKKEKTPTKGKLNASNLPLSLEKRKHSDADPDRPPKKAKLSTFSQEEVIDVLNNNEMTLDDKPTTEIHPPFDHRAQNNFKLKAQDNITLPRIEFNVLPLTESTVISKLVPHDNLEASIINVNNLPSDAVFTFTHQSPQSYDLSISIPRKTRLQAKKESQGEATSNASGYKSISRTIELSGINIQTKSIHTGNAEKKVANLKRSLSLKNEKVPKKINKKTEKTKSDKKANKKRHDKKTNKQLINNEAKKKKGKKISLTNKTTLKFTVNNSSTKDFNSSKTALLLSSNFNNPTEAHIHSKLEGFMESKVVDAPVFSKRYNHLERQTQWHKHLLENNTLAAPKYWPYESSLNSFVFDKRCSFIFNKSSFLNFNQLKEKPKKISHKLESIYGERLEILKRKLSLHGYHSNRYSESDYVFFGAGVDRYYSGRAQNHTYVYKALTRDQLKRLTAVYESFYENLVPDVTKDGVRVDSQRLIFQKEEILRGTVTLGNVIKLKQTMLPSDKEKDIVTENIFKAICSQLNFFLEYGFIVKGGSVREEELKPDNFLIRRSEVTNSSVTFEIIFIDIKHLVHIGFVN
jgi:hypothetical protein